MFSREKYWKIFAKNKNIVPFGPVKYIVNEKYKGYAIIPVIQKIVKMMLEMKAIVELQFEYKVEICEEALLLGIAIENPERYIIKINNTIVSTNNTDEIIGDAIRVIYIGKYIKKGENIFTIKTTCTRSKNILENIYVYGYFKLEKKNNKIFIKKELENLKFGDITKQGYQNYYGIIEYTTMIKNEMNVGANVFMIVNKYAAIFIKVYVNDIHVGFICWPPNSICLSQFLTRGENKISLEVYGSLENSFGPYRRVRKRIGFYSPDVFQEACEINAKEIYVPLGIMQPPIFKII